MRNNEQGRSMIEMLGVLAIVGVLSVGGIAGYSKAMGKFKTNKLIDQINMVTTNVRTLYATQPNYHGLTTTLARNVNLIPSEMYVTGESKVNNAFGGTLQLIASKANEEDADTGEKGYIIAVDNIPSTACVSIVTTDWGSDSDSGLIGMTADNGTTSPAIATAIGTLDEFYVGAAADDDVHTPAGDDSGNNAIPYNINETNTACGVNNLATIAWKYL